MPCNQPPRPRTDGAANPRRMIMNPTLEETIAAMLEVRRRLGSASANSLAEAVIAEHGDAYGSHAHLVQIARPLNPTLCDIALGKSTPSPNRIAELIRPE